MIPGSYYLVRCQHIYKYAPKEVWKRHQLTTLTSMFLSRTDSVLDAQITPNKISALFTSDKITNIDKERKVSHKISQRTRKFLSDAILPVTESMVVFTIRNLTTVRVRIAQTKSQIKRVTCTRIY